MALRKTLDKKGFTLTETLIVVSLFLVIARFGMFVSSTDLLKSSIENERNSIKTFLIRARNQSMNNECFGAGCIQGKTHGVFITENLYTLFQGNSYENRDASFDETVYVKTPFLRSGVQEIVFNQLSGNTEMHGEIRLSDGFQHSYALTINSEGLIEEIE